MDGNTKIKPFNSEIFCHGKTKREWIYCQKEKKRKKDKQKIK